MTDQPPRSEPPGASDDVTDDAAGGLASVVRVERYEDVAAICGRVDTAPTYAVVLNAPQGNRQLTTELGMRRLKRHAEESGRVIAIATSAVALASRARQMGIPVARRPEHVRWEAGGRRVLRLFGHSAVAPSIGRYVQVATILVAAFALVAAALTMAPSVRIVAYPPVEVLARTVTVTASEDRTEIDFDRLALPATEVAAERKLTFAVRTTGSVAVPTGPARVELTITNPGATDITLPAGTIATSASGAEFELVDATVVPAGKTAVSQARASGDAGTDAPANALAAWKDATFAALTVTNAAAAARATEPRQAVDAKDIDALRAMADGLADSDVLKQMLREERPHDAVFLGTARVEVSSAEPGAVVGDLADVVLMEVTVTITALAISSAVLDEVARAVLGDDSAGEFIPGSVTAIETRAADVDADSGDIRTELSLRGEFARGLTRDTIRSAVKGKSESGARSTLAARYGIQQSEVRLTPGWAPWLPRFAFRIRVELRSEASTPEKSPNQDAPAPTAGTPTPRPGGTPTPTPRP